MTRKDDLSYIADTMLLDKIALIDNTMFKTAGMMDDISGTVQSWAKENIDLSSTESVIESLSKLMEPAVIGMISPVLGIADAVVKELTGFSITGVIASLLKPIFSKLKAGEPINSSDINGFGSSIMGVESSLEPIREFEKNGQLLVLVKNGAGHNWLGDLFKKLFVAGPLGKQKGFGLITGLAVWILKTVLKGAGLLALTGGVLGLAGLKNKKNQESSQSQQNQQTNQTEPTYISNENIPYMPQSSPNNFKSSGVGEDAHRNDQSTVWWLPLNGTVENTLLGWTKKIYPELDGHDQEIRMNNSFARISNILKSYIDKGFFEVPKGFTSIKQLIDAAISGLQIKKETNVSI